MIGKVESLKLIKHIKIDLDYCEIEIDFDRIKIFGSYNDLMGFISKTVKYDIRPDFVDGEEVDLIANIAELYTIQTLDRVDEIKLIPKDTEFRAVCNFSVHDLKYGDYDSKCVAFLSGYEPGASKKTRWLDCTMVDKKSKQFNLRFFCKSVEENVDAEAVIQGLIGHYVEFDVTNTKYGYQTNVIELYDVPVVVPPEVEIAASQILKAIQEDSELQNYVNQYNFIEELKTVIDIELGYHLVQIAAEIYFIKAVCNISNEYSMQTLIRAAVTSRGYLLSSKTKFSRPMLNTNKVLKSVLSKDRDLILLLDVLSEEEITPTKRVYIEINKFTKKILDERRGILNEENERNTSTYSMRTIFGGLL